MTGRLRLCRILPVCASILSVFKGVSSEATRRSPLRRALRMDKVDIGLLLGTPEGTRTLQQMETAPTIAAMCAILLGGALCCVGARFAKHSMLGCAFVDGAFCISWLVQRFLQSGGEWESVMSWACFFLGGILLCLMVLANDTFGHCVLGVTAGMMLAFGCNTSFGVRIHCMHPGITLAVFLVVFGAVCGLLTVRRPYSGTIIATSWIGANMVAWGIGYFIGEYPNGASLARFREQGSSHDSTPSAWWGYLASTLVCCLFGSLLQLCSIKRRTRKRRGQDHYTCVATPRANGPAFTVEAA